MIEIKTLPKNFASNLTIFIPHGDLNILKQQRLRGNPKLCIYLNKHYLSEQRWHKLAHLNSLGEKHFCSGNFLKKSEQRKIFFKRAESKLFNFLSWNLFPSEACCLQNRIVNQPQKFFYFLQNKVCSRVVRNRNFQRTLNIIVNLAMPRKFQRGIFTGRRWKTLIKTFPLRLFSSLKKFSHRELNIFALFIKEKVFPKRKMCWRIFIFQRHCN